MADEEEELISTRVPDSKCPVCGKVLDTASGNAAPEPGDISVCFYCHNIMVFDENLALQKADEENELVKELKETIKRIVGYN